MRKVVAELTTHRREGAPLSMRLGLYSGAALYDATRTKYFQYLQTKLLVPIDNRLARFLQSLPDHTDPAAPRQDIVADRLKTYVMLSSTNDCHQIDSKVVGRELTTGLQEIGIREHDPRFNLASTQLDFYSKVLASDNPVPLPLDDSARDRAVSYLRSVNNADRYYRDARQELERRGGEAPALGTLVSDYARVLSGPRQVSAVFTAGSWERLKVMLESGKAVPAPDPCIAALIGDGTPIENLDEEGKHQIEDLYARDYFDAWRSYLKGFSISYTSPQDAAQKLEILSDFRSPLLGLFKFVGQHTYFPRQATGQEEGGIAGKIKQFLGRTPIPKKAEGPPPDVQFTLGDVFKAFQPVDTVVPPQSEKWNDQKPVKAYTDALAKLGSAMQNIARNPTEPQVHADAQHDQDQVLETVRELTSAFNPESIGGVDDIVTRLLREPALATKPFIISRPTDLTKGKLEKDVQGLCAEIRPILSKYPFNSGAPDLSLQEFVQWFAPTGRLWKAQEASLASFVVREGNVWKQKPGTPDVRISQEFLDFLNYAQQVTSTFFPNGDATPAMTYTLRPYFEPNSEQVIDLNLDGKRVVFSRTHLVREDFDWPASSESARQAVGRWGSKSANISGPFSSQTGLWAVFRLFADAEPRASRQSRVEWKKARGASGRLEPIEPPVRLDILSFPGGIDVFNSVFFQSVHCPSRATQ
jgi:type VI protein secretion system component VasK